uniref:Uncharacterized protein n=1 Tax=Steinernema glaseri TaxID=37863 RepID=A0A1I7ZPJ7_9BILA
MTREIMTSPDGTRSLLASIMDELEAMQILKDLDEDQTVDSEVAAVLYDLLRRVDSSLAAESQVEQPKPEEPQESPSSKSRKGRKFSFSKKKRDRSQKRLEAKISPEEEKLRADKVSTLDRVVHWLQKQRSKLRRNTTEISPEGAELQGA